MLLEIVWWRSGNFKYEDVPFCLGIAGTISEVSPFAFFWSLTEDYWVGNLRTSILSKAFRAYLLLLHVYRGGVLKVASMKFETVLLRTHGRLLKYYPAKSLQELNDLARVISWTFIHSHIHEKHNEASNREPVLIADEVALLLKEPADRADAVDYHRITAFFFSCGITTPALEEKAQAHLARAAEFTGSKESVEPLTTSSFSILSKNSKIDYKHAKSEYQYLMKEIISDTLTKEMPKITISAANVGFIVSFGASLFLITGYLYNRFLFQAFGMDTSMFFALGDYITTSLDKIYIAAISAGVGMTAYLVGMYNTAKEVKVRSILGVSGGRNPLDIPVLFLICVTAIVVTVQFYFDSPTKYQPLAVLIFFVVAFGLHELPLHHFLANRIQVITFGMALAYFGSHLFAVVATDIQLLKHGKLNDVRKYEVHFTAKVPFNEATAVLLTRTTEYAVFYDRQTKVSYAIPNGNVSFIKTQNTR
jgi:hypothetical protein